MNNIKIKLICDLCGKEMDDEWRNPFEEVNRKLWIYPSNSITRGFGEWYRYTIDKLFTIEPVSKPVWSHLCPECGNELKDKILDFMNAKRKKHGSERAST